MRCIGLSMLALWGTAAALAAEPATAAAQRQIVADYIAKLNENMAHGVTTENNAAPPIVEMIGGGKDGWRFPEAVFKELGISHKGPGGKHFAGPTAYMKAQYGAEFTPAGREARA